MPHNDMKNYPYFTIEKRIGRLADQVPMQHRHTVIERQYKNGRIGGSTMTNTKVFTALEARQQENRDRRCGAEVEVYLILAPNRCKLRVFNVHGNIWTISDKQIPFNEVDQWCANRGDDLDSTGPLASDLVVVGRTK